MIRSIILKPWEVRALLDGATQIRRPTIPPKWTKRRDLSNYFYEGIVDGLHQFYQSQSGHTLGFPCPYGAVGDTLYVRETVGIQLEPGLYDDYPNGYVIYKADCKPGATFEWEGGGSAWKPAPTMPRWASRLSLTITGVRVQRMAEITQQDAKACGADPWWKCGDGRRDIPNGIEYSIENVPEEKRDYIHGYKYIWYDDYPAYPWESSWCWVLDCERI